MASHHPAHPRSAVPRSDALVGATLGIAPVQWWIALAASAFWVGVMLLASGQAHAELQHPAASNAASPPQEAGSPAPASALQALAQSFVSRQVGSGELPGAARVEVVLGTLDSRLKLAPCQQVRAYWPAGQRAWGQVRVGLRCEQGDVHWNVYWPAFVHVWARGLVASGPLRAGQLVQADDLQVAEVDLAARGTASLTRPGDVVGRALARPVGAGQAMHADDLRPRRYFAPGEPVALTVRGEGFQVAGQGTAITAGDEGQCARIRTDAGRVVCGVPVGERRAEIAL